MASVEVVLEVGVYAGNVRVGLADAMLQNLCARSSDEVSSSGQSVVTHRNSSCTKSGLEAR